MSEQKPDHEQKQSKGRRPTDEERAARYAAMEAELPTRDAEEHRLRSRRSVLTAPQPR